jgi:hypothetical protein
LPQIYCVAPWKPYRVIDVSALYNVLKAQLAPLNNHPEFVVRSLCAQFMFWGGDLLPSPHYITPKMFMLAYTKLNEAVGMPVCSPERIDEDHPYATAVNGAALRILFSLAYGAKWVWNRQLVKGGEDEAREVLDELDGMSVERLEQAVRDACSGAKKSWRKNEVKRTDQRPPSADSGVMEARLGLFSYAIYCLEHALDCVPGASVSLSEIGFICGDKRNQYYVDVYEEMASQMTKRQLTLLDKLGLFRRGKCFRWADTLLRKGASESVVKNKDGESLAELSERVFIWPELDADLIASQ